MAFLATLIFAIHPIHTEVVANLKSRDELLSLFFSLVSLLYLCLYLENKKTNSLALSLLAYTFALFSKESSVTFIAAIFLVLYFFKNRNLIQAAKISIPYLGIVLFYVFFKLKFTGFSIADDEFILNAPYLLASPEEAFTTKIYILFKYILLLFFPHPLSYDYGYNQIPYINFSDLKFWISLLILGLLLGYAILKFTSKNILSFSILFFFATISIVSNLVIPIGTPMGERFLFTPSIGFAIGIGYLIYYFIYKVNVQKIELRWKWASFLLVSLIFLAGYKTINRNKDWKNNTTLFLKDVKASPNSIRALTNAAAYQYQYLLPKEKDPEVKKQLINEAISKLDKAIKIAPKDPEAYVHLSYLYLKENKLALADELLIKAINTKVKSERIDNYILEISSEYVLKGHKAFQNKNLDSASYYFKRAAYFNPSNAEAWWNLGGIHLEKGEIKEAIASWEKTVGINPNYPRAQDLLTQVKKDFEGKY